MGSDISGMNTKSWRRPISGKDLMERKTFYYAAYWKCLYSFELAKGVSKGMTTRFVLKKVCQDLHQEKKVN